MASLPSARPTSRTLHLVDIENLVGDPVAVGPLALGALKEYLEISGWREGDQVIIAANPALLLPIMYDIGVPCSVHPVKGTDAADQMLIGYAVPEWVAERFDRLVVGSGDHAFRDTACAVRDLGCSVVIVSRSRSLSNSLKGEAFGVRLLPEVVLAV